MHEVDRAPLHETPGSPFPAEYLCGCNIEVTLNHAISLPQQRITGLNEQARDLGLSGTEAGDTLIVWASQWQGIYLLQLKCHHRQVQHVTPSFPLPTMPLTNGDPRTGNVPATQLTLVEFQPCRFRPPL
eukprot:1136550-Pelagomonas_calceolata.AAC.2